MLLRIFFLIAIPSLFVWGFESNHTLYVVVGQTGVGKSSLINCLHNSYVTEEGDYESMTNETKWITLHDPGTFQNDTFIDTQGLLDTRNFSVNRTEILWAILKKKEDKKFKFILCLSATNTRHYTQNILKEFITAFGEEILNSIMIVITFPHYGEHNLKKLLGNLDKDVPALKKVPFDSKYPIPNQEVDLKEVLEEVQPYNWTAMEDAKKKIQLRAEMLRNDSSNWYNITNMTIRETNLPKECENGNEDTSICKKLKQTYRNCTITNYNCKDERKQTETHKYKILWFFEASYEYQTKYEGVEYQVESENVTCIKQKCKEWHTTWLFFDSDRCKDFEKSTEPPDQKQFNQNCTYDYKVFPKMELKCIQCDLSYWYEKAWKELKQKSYNMKTIKENNEESSSWLRSPF